VTRGIHWLLEQQRADGTWEESITTGTGFPRVFYISYHLYRDYFPLLALATYFHRVGDDGERLVPLTSGNNFTSPLSARGWKEVASDS